MKKTFTVNGGEVEFTSCTCIFNESPEVRQKALFIHDVSDEHGNGDSVVCWDYGFPTNDAEAETIVAEEYMESDHSVLDTVELDVNRLATLRKAASLTQQALADKSGINIRQIQKMESGESEAGNITLRNAVSIADVLGVDVRELLN